MVFLIITPNSQGNLNTTDILSIYMYIALWRLANDYIKVFFSHLTPLKVNLRPTGSNLTPVRMHVVCVCMCKTKGLAYTFHCLHHISCVVSISTIIRYYFTGGRK